MEAVRSGKAGDAIVSFYPTSNYMMRPSFMELNMTETLLPGFRDAIKFMVSLEHRKRVEIFFNVFHTILEILHASDPSTPSTIAEKYFGLYRVRKTSGDESNSTLSRFQRLATILESVVIPYLMSLSDREEEQEEKVPLRIYKLIRALLSTMYLVGLSETVSPIQLLFGIRLARRQSQQENRGRKIFSFVVWGLIYGFQLMQWYYANQRLVGLNSNSNHIKSRYPSQQVVCGLPADPSLCPLCLRERRNPTILVATGHVFCYSCIWNWISRDDLPVCPVTKKFLPLSKDKLHYIRRLV
jgi:hypothetical protein